MRFTLRNPFRGTYRWALPLTLALAPLPLACRDRAGSTTSPPDAAPPVVLLPPLPPEPAGLTIRLTPHPAQQIVDVEVHLVGDAAASVDKVAIARDWAGTDGMSQIRGLRVRDARGEITALPAPDDDGPDHLLALDRPPEGGHLALRYAVASAPQGAVRYALHLDRERLSGVGHSFLLLPRLPGPLPAHVQVRPGDLAPGATGGSSFGPGEDLTVTASPNELAHAIYVAGRIRVQDHGADERLVVLGRPAFDTDNAFDFAYRVETALRRLFGPLPDSEPAPFSLILVAEPGLGKAHDGALLHRSLGLWFAEDRPLDAPLRIAAAHELVHRWIGGAVRLADEKGGDIAWFSEGFTVHYARKILLAEHAITTADFAADIERTEGPSHVRSREAYQRGALYAASLDAALQKASSGARSLDDIVHALLERTRADHRAALPLSALRDLIVRELGPARGEELDWVMQKGHGELRLPDDAFGRCFERARTRRRVYDLGFDPESIRKTPGVVHGLVRGSAAAKAGLRDGAIVLSSKIPPAPADVTAEKPKKVELTVADRKGGHKIRYVPIGDREERKWAAKRGCR